MAGPKTVYSLTETAGTLCLVRGSRSGRTLQVQVQARSASMDDPEFRTAVQSANLVVESGAAVWASLMPGVSCLLRWIPVPFSSIRKSAEVLPSLLDIQIPFPIEQCVYGVTRWAEDGGSSRAQVFAAREQDVKQAGSEWFKGLGIDPQWIVHEGLAMTAIAAVGLPVHARQVLISAASDRLSAAYLEAGAVDQFFSVRLQPDDPRAVQEGTRQLTERLRASLGADVAVEDVLWFGASECPEESRAILEELCREPGGVSVAADAEGLSAKLLAAFVLGQENQGMNFRQGRCIHPASVKQKEEQGQWGRRALTVAAAIWILLSVGGLIVMSRAESSLRRDVLQRAEILAPGKRIFPGQEVLIVNRALDESRQERKSLVAFAQGGIQAEWDAIVREAHRARIQIRALTLTMDGIELLADADGERAAQDFLSSVESVTGPMTFKRRGGTDRYSFSAVGPGA